MAKDRWAVSNTYNAITPILRQAGTYHPRTNCETKSIKIVDKCAENERKAEGQVADHSKRRSVDLRMLADLKIST